MLFLRLSVSGQTAITTITATTASSTSSVKNVTAPADASITVKAYDVTYGTGLLEPLQSFVVGGSTYDDLLFPDTVILQRQFAGDEQLSIFYSRTSFDAGPTPGTIGIETTGVVAADSIYLLTALNAGLTNILSNVDDITAGFEAEIERVDFVWFQGIQSTDPSLSSFPVFDLNGNDNVAMAAITSLDSNGDPASYGQIVGIGDNVWTGGNINIGDITAFRQETAALDNLPFANFGSVPVEGISVSFQDLGITAGQSFFGYSLFAPDVVNGYTSGTLTAGPHTPAAGITLSDISTFPDNTPRSIAGLDLVISASVAASVDNEISLSVGPGGAKDALRTWLKANDGAFVTNGGAASTEGTNVGFWEDQSLGNHDYTTLATAPTFRSSTSSINFNPTVDFISAAERGLQLGDNNDYNTGGPFTRKGLNIAFRTEGSDVSTRQQLFEEGGGTNGLGIYIDGGTLYGAIWNRGNSGSAGAPWNDATPTNFVSTSVSTDTEYILTMEFDGSSVSTGTITFYLNGQSFGVLSSVGLLYSHGNDIGLGDQDGGSRYHNNTTAAASFYGEISEFIYCNEPASFPTAQRQQIESYLAIKYGITLDQSTAVSYVNADGNIVFNTADPASIGGYLEYNNDIAGIARDDASELDQPASKSENPGSIVTIDRGATLSNDDTWLIWGNDGGVLTESSSVSSPSNIDTRLERVWRVAERNEAQTTSVSFDLTGLGLGSNAADYSLLVAANNSGADFSSATVITGGSFAGDVLTFTGVDLDDGEYFSLATAFFFCTPGRYNDGIQTWLRADAGVTTATEGANVTLWADQTPTGNNGTNLTSPVYRATTNLINDNPTIDFSTGSTGLALPTITGLNDGQSLSKKFTIAFKTGDITPATNQVIYEQGGATRGLNVYIESSTLHISGWNQASDGVGAPWNTAAGVTTVNTTSIASNTSYVLTFDYAGNDAITGTITGYLNGQSFGTPLSNVGRLYPHTDAIGLGDENSASRYDDATTSGALSFDGFISEISYYNEPSSYTSTDRNRIETSMAIKYGITLDQTSATNYTRSDGMAVWNAITNATYNNDIAGIGRDDDACLDQKQSQSENSGSIVKMGLNTIESNNASNANAFADDGDFLIWGNDGDFADQANANTLDLPGGVTERIERIWRVDDTGDVGATTITFDLTGLGYGTNLTDFQLIVSNSATMASGSTVPATSYNVGTNTVTFTGVNLTDGQFFTLGTDRDICAPGGVETGLLLSLKGDIGTTGTTTVTAWADQSANAFSATATNGPELISNGINFNPSLQFNGTNETMAIASGILGTSSPNDLVVFGISQVNTVQDSWLFFEGLASSGRFSAHVPWGDNNVYYDYPNATEGNGRISEPWGTSTGTPHIWTLFSSTSSLTTASGNANKAILRDGTVLDTNTSSITGTGNNSSFNIASNGSSNFYDADIAEILIYNTAPSEQELEQIQTYFAIKYGIFKNSTDIGSTGAVDESDYFASNGSVIWDRSANSAYHQDVAGIGRDDTSCLNQKQSSSEATDDILTIGLGNVAANNASNANSFADDRDFLVWGNDGGSTNQASDNTSDLPSSVSSRMQRIWKVQDNGTVGNTELQFDLASLGYSTVDASAYSLLIGNTATMADATFTTGGTFNGDVLSFTGVDLTDGQFFTIGTAFETCGPGGVNTNIALWLRADLEVFSDAGSTAAVNLDNTQQWNDQSSPAENASEIDLGGVGPVLPVYRTEEFNFNPVLRFSDPNSSNASYMRSANSVSGDFTLISVFKSGQSDGTSNDFVNSPALIGADVSSSTSDYGLGIENGRITINANTTTGTDAESTTTYNNDFVHFALATRVQSNGAVEIFVDSESVATGTGSTAALDAPTTIGIGNHSDANVAAQFSGDIAETIVFSQALDENERTRVESYLAVKYGVTRVVSGLTEAAEDYLAADGGVIWDIDAQGTTYHNDIFGIGRDDLSCLEQIKSKSENADALVTFDNNGSFGSNDSWLLSGNDNAAIEATGNVEKPASIRSRLNREWRVQETGTVGTIRLSYDLSTVTGPTGVGTNNLNQTRLMVDDDGDFSNGGTTLISPVAIDGTNDIVTFEVDFTSGQYYTLGSIEVAALPITLISFDASVNDDNQVKLDWVTASEVNNAFYTIERSTNGVDFETVGRIDGAGNSDAILYYSYTDNKPFNGLSFYRLRQTDFSGESDVSEIRSVRIKSEFISTYKAYPNPIRQGETLRIAYSVERDQTLRMTVVSSSGQMILRKEEEVLANEEYIELSTNRLQKGLNLIRILDENQQVITLKVLVR